MSIIVDKEEVRNEILLAFQNCIEDKPLSNITLRDIAKKAGMSHAKLLYYFKDKEELIMTYVRFTRDYMTTKCVGWFNEHNRNNYSSNFDYMNNFMKYVAEGKAGENRPNATTQTYILSRYDPKIGEMVREEFKVWRETMEQCLVQIYGPEVGPMEAEAMMALISGVFLCNYLQTLTGDINGNILGYLNNLAK